MGKVNAVFLAAIINTEILRLLLLFWEIIHSPTGDII